MSRSRRKNPVLKGGMKAWRTAANKCMRRRNRAKLHAGDEDFLRIREASNIWTSPADGCWSDWLGDSERRKEGAPHTPTTPKEIEFEERWKKRMARWYRKLRCK